jgi:sulfur relay (sulfurtransferase) DsrC/TusE family protein
MTKQTAVKKPISMYPPDWEIVEQVNQTYGLRNVSAAVRHIVNEYHRLTNQEANPAPRPQDEQ